MGKEKENISNEDIEQTQCENKECECTNKEDVVQETEFTKEELLKTIEERDELIGDMKDKIQRNLAEFDNFRKRTEKEKSEMFDIGVCNMLKNILPIIDNFERGFSMIPKEEAKTQFAIGMDMVYKQLLKVLEETKVTPIEALGQEFNPELHNAVSHVEKEDVGENIIVEEYEKGYKYKDTVIRHSMVIVAN